MSDVADMLHRPQTSVRVKARQHNIIFAKYSSHWTEDQDIYLQEHWNNMPVSNIANTLKKSRASVYIRAKALNLEDADYKRIPKNPREKKAVRSCYKCKNTNDRPAPATRCSACYIGRPKPKGTGWSSRRCKNCEQGYTGKTRDFCTRDCKSEFATKERMELLGNAHAVKKCIKCEQDKPIWMFNLDSSRKDKVHPYCRVCQKNNKLLTADNAKNKRLLNFYGITLEEYTRLLEAQNGHCAMCLAIPTERSLAVDHDHITGAIRGLLCLTCNKYKLGQLTMEDVDKIYQYLHNPPADNFFGQRRFVPSGMEKPKRRRRRKVS